MAANHFRYAPHDELLDGRDREAIRRNRRIEEDVRVNRYKKLKISNAIRVIVRPQRTVMIRFGGVLGMMTVEMRMDDAVAVVPGAVVVDMCMNERGGKRSPLERD